MNKNKKYKVKEIFYSIQGEGYHSGKPAVFIRFSGCNIWSGREEDRMKAICKFCDTDFVGTDGKNGGVYSMDELITRINHITIDTKCRFIVFTGGEPLLQLDEPLLAGFKEYKYYLSVETNGTILVPEGLDWITVSPKSGAEFNQTSGDELKIVYPQEGINPSEYENLEFEHFYLQPKYDKYIEENIKSTLEYCMDHPKWKLSIQLHKILGIN
ncbi:MAG TPA: 7-carboxy-7-deazaguanine synthase [Bacteroidetes bacterium]|nr:7-carboxy-7-deazaguanine synthase [Bacteroidota bacterium]